MLVNPPQSSHAQARPKLVPHSYPGHLTLATQSCKLAPRALFRQHFHQQIDRMHGGKHAQQVQPVELCGAVGPASAAGATVGPTLIDEIVRDIGIQKVEQFSRAGGGEFRVHEKNPTPLNPTGH